MKKTKIIIPALGMLLLSTAASVTGTVAWFSMNSDVTASTMSVKAVAESGIAIAPYHTNNTVAPEAAEFKNVAVADQPSKDQMRPTFTADGTTWYHAKAVDVNNGQAISAEGYEKLGSDVSDVYLLNKFQIKSTAETTDVYVKGITLVAYGNENFDACARVLVKTSYADLFFAPVHPETHTGTETTQTLTPIDPDATTPVYPGDLQSPLSITFTPVNTKRAKTLQNVSTSALDVSIYVYFDGEDAACKSINIYNFAATTVDVVFSSITPTAD